MTSLMNNSLTINISSFNHIPFNTYQNDFTFIVNDTQFETSKFVADILFPKISRYHLNDPTINEYFIYTESSGDFQNVLNFVSIANYQIQVEDIPFFADIFQELETEITITSNINENISIDNVFDLIKIHERSQIFFRENLEKEIEFLSKNFYEAVKTKQAEMETLSHNTMVSILNNPNLYLENEDQLLRFINRLYISNRLNSDLYEYVHFVNVEEESINEFINIFDINDITSPTWSKLSTRLKYKIDINDENQSNCIRYMKKKIDFNGQEFKGVFNYIQKISNINDEINITTSSKGSGSPFYLTLYGGNIDYSYYTNDEVNSWICFEFKNHRIIPKNYTLRSNGTDQGQQHMKSWIVEGSNDLNSWEKIDEQGYCMLLNGKYSSHTFSIQNSNDKEYKYIKIRQTSSAVNGQNYLYLTAVEFYGSLIKEKQ